MPDISSFKKWTETTNEFVKLLLLEREIEENK